MTEALAVPYSDTRSARKGLALTALLIAAFAINLDTTIVNVALPALVQKLHATDSQLQWVVDAYNLVFAALILTAGSLSDRLGRKGMLLAGLAVFTVATVAGGLTGSAATLIGARAVMGLGAAMIFPATLSLISNIFTDRAERARAIGVWGASAGAAIALGPIAGGWLIERYSWPAVFFAMAPVAVAAMFLVVAHVPTSRDSDPAPLDIGGFAGSTAAMALFVYTLIEAPAAGWLSGRTIGGLAAGAALALGFIAWERRRAAPMLEIGLFRDLRFSAASVSVTVAFFTLFGFIFLMTQYFQFIRGYSPLGTGLRLLPVAASVGVSSVIGTKLAVRVGTKVVVATGLLCIAAFYAWVATVISGTTGYGVVAAQMVLYGIGMGLTSAPATESIMGAVRADQAGVGSAINDATRLLGGTLGVAVIGSIYASLYGNRVASHLPAALPAPLRQASGRSVGAAFEVARQAAALGHGDIGAAVSAVATGAFLHGISVSCAVAGGVAAAGALAAAVLLPAQPGPGGAG